MLFNSGDFLYFLLLVLGVYYSLSFRFQNYFLLAASYVFYGYWDWRFLGLILTSTAIDYLCAKKIDKTEKPSQRKLFLYISLASNLTILGFFKYFSFFIEAVSAMLQSIGLNPSVPMLEIILPVGISFYTFQSLSYTIDVYRNKIDPCKSFPNFALYVAFFPQLVAGPIERASNLLPQLSKSRKVTWENFSKGIELIILGYVKKIGIADGLASYVNMRFAHYELSSSFELVLATYLFAIQIYCDFSGYTDIARGVAKLLGIDLMRNFEQPYFSTSITNFWRRWHISLSTWLRDYLYISLGGNRVSALITYRNLFITMLLGGLWHGANWTFVIWGGAHGLLLAFERLTNVKEIGQNIKNKFFKCSVSAVQIFITFHIVCFLWIIFRAENIDYAWNYITCMFSGQKSSPILPETSLFDPRPLTLIVIWLYLDTNQYFTKRHTFLQSASWVVRAITYALLLASIFIFGGLNEKVPFIYFQF